MSVPNYIYFEEHHSVSEYENIFGMKLFEAGF